MQTRVKYAAEQPLRGARRSIYVYEVELIGFTKIELGIAGCLHMSTPLLT